MPRSFKFCTPTARTSAAWSALASQTLGTRQLTGHRRQMTQWHDPVDRADLHDSVSARTVEVPDPVPPYEFRSTKRRAHPKLSSKTTGTVMEPVFARENTAWRMRRTA
ncbi:hypothetical protein CSOJ01_08907 [Colletotrichum sojae]|uniref:Uncharacterized protein n=1 Tax=Colletotrichum sojae TaxID=2175907 RepID=A0A8H6J5E8_9PEZI|nr:hypothetical protein CSOJ01_08907 [Colletotrichum sojae]